MQQIRLCPIVVMLVVAGCAGPIGTIHTDSPPPSPATAFDGSYRSTLQQTASAVAAQGNNWCESPGEPIVTVSNGQFSYAVQHPNAPDGMTAVFQATFAQDGSFAGQVTSGTMTGQVSGTHMEGRIDGQACLYTFTADKI